MGRSKRVNPLVPAERPPAGGPGRAHRGRPRGIPLKAPPEAKYRHMNWLHFIQQKSMIKILTSLPTNMQTPILTDAWHLLKQTVRDCKSNFKTIMVIGTTGILARTCVQGSADVHVKIIHSDVYIVCRTAPADPVPTSSPPKGWV